MARTPFLVGALDWLYDGRPPAVCARCGYDWATTFEDALALIAGSPDRLASSLVGRDGTAAQPDGSWPASGYLYHLADLADGWAERWQQILVEPGSLLVPWDPDELADARGYRHLHTAPGLWAVRGGVQRLLEETSRVGRAATYRHDDWGEGDVADALVWLGHEFHHHELDVRERARPL